MAGGGGELVSNKQVIFRDYVNGFPKDSDMFLTSGNINLKVPEDSDGILVKNLYLSCDPYMRLLMNRIPSQSVFTAYTPGSVSHLSTLFSLENFGKFPIFWVN